jgi:hypothetical protein
MRMKYDLEAKHEVMGSALHIPLPSGLKAGSSVAVKIGYRTTKDSTALQWLDKEYVIERVVFVMAAIILKTSTVVRQTQGKAFPYLFSQCQPIYARALAPLQGFIPAFSVLSFIDLNILACRHSFCENGMQCDLNAIMKLTVGSRHIRPK